MKLLTILTTFAIALMSVPVAQAREGAKAAAKPAQSAEEVVRARTEQFLTARQARKGIIMRRYFDPDDIKKLNEDLKLLYASTKEGMEKGTFSRSYVKQSIVDGDFAEPYKHAILRYLLENANFDRELDLAFTRYLESYSYRITKFQINKIVLSADGRTADAQFSEYRQGPNEKQPRAASSVYRWQLKNSTWYLALDRPVHY